MTTFATDSTNDLYLDSSGQIATAAGKEAYGEIIASEIRTLSGEIQLDIDLGVPYLSTAFAGNISLWRASVRSIIESHDFVRTIVSFDTDVSGNTLSYRIVISTDDGDITVNG